MENSHAQNKLKLFENKKIRYVWNAEEEEWYFSVIDVVEVLSESQNPRRYWSDLKIKVSLKAILMRSVTITMASIMSIN